MTILQAAAILTLWKSRQFNTLDIAGALGVPEADICTVLNAAREREYGPDLRVVAADKFERETVQ